MKRGGNLKRTPLKQGEKTLKRGGALKRTPLARKPTEKPVAATESSRPASKVRKAGKPPRARTPALGDAACVSCERKAAHQHHVVLRQVLERYDRKAPAHPDSVIALCYSEHANHHSATGPKLDLSLVPTRVWDFVEDLMGGAAYDHLRSRYVGEHPRLERLKNLPGRGVLSGTSTNEETDHG